MEFNPNATSVLGPEVDVRGKFTDGSVRYKAIGSPADVLAVLLDSTVTETVTQMAMGLRSDAPLNGTTAVLVEVLTAGAEVPVNPLTTTFIPNGATVTSVETNGGSTVSATLAAAIDESNPPDDTDYVRTVSSAGNEGARSSAVINLQFNTSGVLTGKRIRAVRLIVRASKVSTSFSATLGVNISGQSLLTSDLPLTTTPTNYVIDLGEIYIPSGQPWTVAQLQALSTGTPRITLRMGNSLSAVRVQQCYLEVDYCDENRLTRNVIQFSGNFQRVLWTPQKVDGSSNLAKVNGTDLTVVVRQPRYGGGPGVPNRLVSVLVEPTTTTLPPSMPSIYQAASVNADGTIASLGVSPDRLRFTLTEFLVSGVESVDAQVYSNTSTQSNSWWPADQKQRFTPGANFSCAGVRLIGTVIYSTGSPPSLTVNLRTTVGSTLVATGVLTEAVYVLAQGADPSAQWVPLQVGWVGGTVVLTSGVQYYVEVLPGGPVGGTGTVWSLPQLTIIGDTTASPQSWHGSTDTGVRGGFTNMDFPWLLIGPATAPVGVAVATMEAAIESAVGTGLTPYTPGDCIMSGIPFNRVTWTATALGGSFGMYELQRMDSYTDWQTIAFIDHEAAPSFDDYEARINDQSCYRVRVATAFNVYSAWSASSCGAILPKAGDGYTFTTNHSTGSGVAYSDTYSDTVERAYTSPEASELTLMKLSGRDYVVAFQPCERRGEQFTRDLLVNALRTPAINGITAFDALRDLAKTGYPYVCVRDENGDRWFAALTVPDFRIRQPKDWYRATVTVTEVADVATPVRIP